MSSNNRRTAIIGTVCVALAFAILLLVKGYNRVGCPQFWAEDGNIFFAELLRSGWRSVFVVYAGYLHVATRLFAACAMAFPAVCAPIVFFYAAFLVQLGVMVLIARCGLFRNWWLGVLAALVLAFQPFDGPAEIFLNLTALHWFLALLIPISMMGAECRFGAVSYWMRMLAHSIVAITNPYAILVVPIHFIRAFQRRRNSAEVLYFLVVTAFCCVQAVVLAFNLTSTAPSGMSTSEAVRGYVAYFVRMGTGWILPPPVYREVLSLLTLRQGVNWLGVAGLATSAAALLLVVYGVYLIGFRKVFSQLRVLFLCGAASVVASLGRGPTAYCSDRYFFLPNVFMLLFLLKLIDLEGVTRRAKIVIGTVVCMYFCSTIPCFVLTGLEDLHWKEEYSLALKDRSHVIKLHPIENKRWHFRMPQKI